MRNKILIVGAKLQGEDELEGMLQEVVETGGELFLTETTEDGLTILQKEKPQLVFLDARLVGAHHEKWVCKGVHVVLMRHKHEPDFGMEDSLIKPVRYRQVWEKCRAILNPEPAPQLPPM